MEVVKTLPHSREVTAICAVPDNGTLIFLTEEGELQEFKIHTGEVIKRGVIKTERRQQVGGGAEEDDKESLWSVEKCGDYVFVASQYGIVYQIEYDTFATVSHRKVSQGYVKVKEAGGKLFWASYQALVAWEPNTLNEVKKFAEIPYAPAALHSKGRRLICDMFESAEKKKNALHLWDVETFQLLKKFTAPPSVFSTEMTDQYLFAGLQDGEILVWDIQTGEKLQSLKQHQKLVYALHTAGNILVSGSNDSDIILWNITDRKVIKSIKKHGGWVNCIRLTPYNLISGSEDKSVLMWSLASMHDAPEQFANASPMVDRALCAK
jgi:WD40 repeat protein